VFGDELIRYAALIEWENKEREALIQANIASGALKTVCPRLGLLLTRPHLSQHLWSHKVKARTTMSTYALACHEEMAQRLFAD
jgi:hypothetical protein